MKKPKQTKEEKQIARAEVRAENKAWKKFIAMLIKKGALIETEIHKFEKLN